MQKSTKPITCSPKFALCIACNNDTLGSQYLGLPMSDLHKIACNGPAFTLPKEACPLQKLL
jgi:hypothetical protein